MSVSEQLSMFEVEIEQKPTKGNPAYLFPLDEYDHVLISLSGGKDSVACLLHLMEEGVPLSKMELWHQSVDGNPDDEFDFLDWPAAESYNNAIGELFGIPVSYEPPPLSASRLRGGFSPSPVRIPDSLIPA